MLIVFRAFSTVENGKLAFPGDVGVRSGHYIKNLLKWRKYVKIYTAKTNRRKLFTVVDKYE